MAGWMNPGWPRPRTQREMAFSREPRVSRSDRKRMWENWSSMRLTPRSPCGLRP
jgi:hypothetical protein